MHLQIGAGRDVEAMEFGRAVVDPAASTAEDHELLEDVVALFAYTGVGWGGGNAVIVVRGLTG